MTEAQWLECDDPVRLLSFAARQPFRKLLLYGVACCREHWHLLRHPDSRAAVEWAERYADGLATRDDDYGRLDWRSEGVAFHYEAAAQSGRVESWVGEWTEASRHDLARLSGRIVGPERVTEAELVAAAAYLANQLMTLDCTDPLDFTLSGFRPLLSVSLLRDIFGNPFRPMKVRRPWRSAEWIDRARQMYESRDFAAMTILADKFQDAGCEDVQVLGHCRGPRPACPRLLGDGLGARQGIGSEAEPGAAADGRGSLGPATDSPAAELGVRHAVVGGSPPANCGAHSSGTTTRNSALQFGLAGS